MLAGDIDEEIDPEVAGDVVVEVSGSGVGGRHHRGLGDDFYNDEGENVVTGDSLAAPLIQKGSSSSSSASSSIASEPPSP